MFPIPGYYLEKAIGNLFAIFWPVKVASAMMDYEFSLPNCF